MELEELNKRVKELEEQVERNKKRISRLEEGKGKVMKEKAKPLTLPEFMRNKDPSTHKGKFLLIGYFLEKYRAKEGFKTKDIKERYKKCNFDLPANPYDIISKSAGEGLFFEKEEEKGSNVWALTKTGEEKVEEEFISKEED